MIATNLDNKRLTHPNLTSAQKDTPSVPGREKPGERRAQSDNQHAGHLSFLCGTMSLLGFRQIKTISCCFQNVFCFVFILRLPTDTRVSFARGSSPLLSFLLVSFSLLSFPLSVSVGINAGSPEFPVRKL
jgi:hypothetical protein